MTRTEILEKIESLQRELNILKTVLTPAKKIKRAKKDYTRHIRQEMLKCASTISQNK